MPLLTMHGGAKAYGERTLFNGLHLELQAGVKIAVVGRNGSGKTSLLRILAGLDAADAGKVHLSAGASVGYLRQDVHLDPDHSVLSAALEAFADLCTIEHDLRSVEAHLAHGAIEGEWVHKYGDLQDRFEQGGGYSADARARQTLAGLGFAADQLSVQCRHLSGGERVRLGLATLLLRSPDFLLLDEPTNHLDLPAIMWLEKHLLRSPMGVLVVSHDQHFLDAVTDYTLEMTERPRMYPGNYSHYMRLRGAYVAAGMEEYRRAQAELPRLRTFIAACRAASVLVPKNRLRRLAQLDAVPAPSVAMRAMRLEGVLPGQVRGDCTGTALDITALRKAFSGRELFGGKGFSTRVVYGERIGLVGANGSGKSTLLRILRGALRPDHGDVRWTAGTRIGWLSQSLEWLDPDLTLVEQLTSVPGIGERRARDVLAQYMFEDEYAVCRTGDCSGGERCRVALARLLLEPWDALLLDEPTNHLDAEARRALETGLTAFGGSIVVASHDRFFLDRVCRRTWVFSAQGIVDFGGNYSAYAEGQRSSHRSPVALAAAIRHAEDRAAVLSERLSQASTFADGRGRRVTQEWDALQAELASLQAEWHQAVSAGIVTLS